MQPHSLEENHAGGRLFDHMEISWNHRISTEFWCPDPDTAHTSHKEPLLNRKSQPSVIPQPGCLWPSEHPAPKLWLPASPSCPTSHVLGVWVPDMVHAPHQALLTRYRSRPCP